ITQLIGEASGSEARRAKQAEGVEMDDTTKVELDEKTELRRTLVYFGWFIGGAAGIGLLGIVITLPLLAFLYMLVEGREKLVPSVIMAACTYGMIWGLFEYTLEMRWPPGLLFGY
ncbi:MAG TPA: tripartite tricarboxylate transporter TctB family protein, partial [Candidatus Binatia bacterium]